MAEGAVRLTDNELSKNSSSEITKEGMGRCSISLFTDFLFGLNKRQWSGGITVELSDSVKKTLYMRNGELVFATSSLIDDRLGEVAYRRGLISLEQLFDTSVKVEANVKFGQLLMENQVFTKTDLWEALKVQILEIIKSIMLEDTLFFEVQSEVGPGSIIMFDDETSTLLDRAYSFGCMYRDFSAGVTSVTKIKENEGASTSVPDGHFLGDMFKSMVEAGSVGAFLQSSRLSRPYSLLALMDVVHYGYCNLDPEVKLSFDATPQSDAVLSKINFYAQVLELVNKLLDEEKIQFPSQDLSLFAHNLNSPTFLSIFLDDRGRLAPNSVNCILSQSRLSIRQSEYFARCIESLIHFLIQISSDVLPSKSVDRLRRDVQKFASSNEWV